MICKSQTVQIVREFQFYTRLILKKSVSRPAGYHTGFRLQPSALETGEREGLSGPSKMTYVYNGIRVN